MVVPSGLCNNVARVCVCVCVCVFVCVVWGVVLVRIGGLGVCLGPG